MEGVDKFLSRSIIADETERHLVSTDAFVQIQPTVDQLGPGNTRQ
jgi:hypothetical protein